MEEAVCETGKLLVLQIIKMAGYPHRENFTTVISFDYQSIFILTKSVFFVVVVLVLVN